MSTTATVRDKPRRRAPAPPPAKFDLDRDMRADGRVGITYCLFRLRPR